MDEGNLEEGTPQGYPVLDTDTKDITIEGPNMQQERLDRLERNREVMEAFDPLMTNTVFPKDKPVKSSEETAAVCIQRYYRGYLGRKKYVELLFEQFSKEEKSQLERVVQQVEEGELLVENHQLEVLLEDNITTRRNKSRHYLSYVITIQRAWKAYVKRKQSKESARDTKFSEEKNELTFESNDCKPLSDASKNHLSGSLSSLDNLHISVSRESTPDDVRLNSTNKKILQKLGQELDVDSGSISSDYSEVSAPLRDIAEAELQIVDKNKLSKESDTNLTNSKQASIEQVVKHPGESDEDFSRRLRKINLLSIAQEFAELKKLNAHALPFDLHKVQGQIEDSSQSESSSASTSRISSEMSTPVDSTISFENMKNVDNLVKKDLNCNSINAKSKNEDEDRNSITTGATNIRSILFQNDAKNNSKQQARNDQINNKNDSEQKGEKEGDFDVYNIETAVPHMDWEGLEKQLQQATEEQKKRSESQRNDREEIRRKLAMGTGVEEDYYSGEKAYKKPNLSSRLQSGMNLQICFMNESPGDEQNLTQDKITTEVEPKEELKPQLEVLISKENQSDVNKNDVSKNDVKNGNSIADQQKQDDGDFFKRQARLQREAKIALAQASTMAHMQLEVEKQKKKKSPIVDVVGIPCFTSLQKGQRFGKKILYEMNLAQLQVVVNDLHSQIENLNEDLVKFLMERDELHMEQDSKLVDIEDLTRRAEERAGKVNPRQKKDARKS